MTTQYVYGVTVADTELPNDLRGIHDQPVTLLRRDQLAAVVSNVDGDRPLGAKADVIAHNMVVEAIGASGSPILPMSFGAVMTDAYAIADELLAENSGNLTSALSRLSGRVQMTLRGYYVEETLLSEVLDESPEARELAQAVQDAPEDEPGPHDQRLGEIVSKAVRGKRNHDATRMIEMLAPLAEAVTTREPTEPPMMLDVSFLVPADRRPEFSRRAEELAVEEAGRVRLRVVGPLAPYDFATVG